MNNCQFCDQKTLQPQIIKETNEFMVIQARRPLALGHVMIIPKQHTNSFDLTKTQSIEFFELLTEFTNLFYERVNATGVNVFSNLGISAGQSIPHLHFHIMSRFDNENESPFIILNDQSKYKALKQLSVEEIEEKVKNLR